MKMNLLYLVASTFLIFGGVGCQLSSKKESLESGTVSFAEYQKIITPRSSILPLPGGKDSLLILSLPTDKYPKLYTLNHQTKKFSLRYDAGRPLGGVLRDRADKNYYILLDNNGDENHQIYQFDLNTNMPKKIFGHDGFKSYIFDFSFDGSIAYIASNHESKAIFKIYSLDVQTARFEALTDGKVSFYGGIADKQGQNLILSQVLGNNEQSLYILNLKNKKLSKILGKKSTKYQPTFFEPNGEFFHLNSDDGKDRMGCAKVALANPKELIWTNTNVNRDIECGYKESHDITTAVSSFDGRIQVELFKGIFGEPLNVPFPENSIISQFSLIPSSQQGVARVLRSNSPGDYFQFDLSNKKNKELIKISNLNQSSVKSFANSFDLYYDSFDGMKIHGIIYAKDEWLTQSQKRPLIVWPHGGPDSSERHAYHAIFQYWVQKGYVVFAPNFRGSTGYGKKFETLNDRDWGGGHIKDVVYGRRAMGQLPYVDNENVFIVGASFGGFSTLSTITQYPKEFKGAVAIVALANLFTFMKSIPPDQAWQSEFLAEVGHPIKDKKLYQERSPFFHAKNIKTPLKIYQAENDVRTVKAEMDAFVDELKKHNVPVQYEVLLQEGHGISRAENWEKILQGSVEFLSSIK